MPPFYPEGNTPKPDDSIERSLSKIVSLLSGSSTVSGEFGDNEKLFFGDDNDSSVFFDGTDMVLNPRETGSGNLAVQDGDLLLASDNQKLIFGTGSDVEQYFDGADYFIKSNDLSANAKFLEFGRVEIISSTAELRLISTPNERSFGLEMANFTFRIRNRQTNQTILQVQYNDNDVNLPLDGQKLQFGAGQDASIRYDGTDFIFNSQESGSGDFLFNGGSIIIDKEGSSGDLALGIGTAFGFYRDLFSLNLEIAGTRSLKYWANPNFVAVKCPDIADAATPSDFVDANEVTFALDETSNNLEIWVMYSDGATFRTGTVALT